MGQSIKVFVESGQKKTFIGAIDWPGWCRSGRDEPSALQNLIEHAHRYASALIDTGIPFQQDIQSDNLVVIERHQGNASTDFGAPDAVLNADLAPFDQSDLDRSLTILEAVWQAFDWAINRATAKQLSTGPRGGGRTLEKIIAHVMEADLAYLSRLSWKTSIPPEMTSVEELSLIRKAIRAALQAKQHGELPERGPRGGALWTARYFIRRAAWHLLDHLWEIEDRLQDKLSFP